MTNHPLIRPSRLVSGGVLCLLGLLPLCLLTAPMLASDVTPARVSHIDGTAAYEPAGDVDWSEVTVNLPLVGGDRIVSHADSRLEVELGDGNFIRLGDRTDLTFVRMADRQADLRLDLGDLIIRSRDSAHYRVSTPHASILIKKKGLYRISVNDQGQTRVTVRKGEAEIENGAAHREIESGEELIIEGSQSSLDRVALTRDGDSFDSWSDRRDAHYLNSHSVSYVGGYYHPGVYDLDWHGDWLVVAQFGRCWFPHVAVGWAPYRVGRWCYHGGWGWTWISYEPWGWLPYHYGHWVFHQPYGRWGWVPGHIGSWSPALVNFYFGFGHVGWAPRPYHRYGSVINHNSITVINNTFINSRRGRDRIEGLTVVRTDDFRRRRADHAHVNNPSREIINRLQPGLPSEVTTRPPGGRNRVSVDRPNRGADNRRDRPNAVTVDNGPRTAPGREGLRSDAFGAARARDSSRPTSVWRNRTDATASAWPRSQDRSRESSRTMPQYGSRRSTVPDTTFQTPRATAPQAPQFGGGTSRSGASGGRFATPDTRSSWSRPWGSIQRDSAPRARPESRSESVGRSYRQRDAWGGGSPRSVAPPRISAPPSRSGALGSGRPNFGRDAGRARPEGPGRASPRRER